MLHLARIGTVAPVLRAVARFGATRSVLIPLGESQCLLSRENGVGKYGFGRASKDFSRRVAVRAAVDTTQATVSSGPVAGQEQGPTFQEALSRLQQYWASVGCAAWLPHNTEVTGCSVECVCMGVCGWGGGGGCGMAARH
jgi:hypothetical protein